MLLWSWVKTGVRCALAGVSRARPPVSVFRHACAQAPGPFVLSLQQCGAAAAADAATVVWLLLVGNNGTKTLETLKAAVFSNNIVQTVIGDVILTDNVHLIIETAEEENLPLPCHWVKV